MSFLLVYGCSGACDAAPADGEQPPEGQHEEVQGPGSDVTGALKQREEESTAAAAESAAEEDAAPAGQLDGQLGTASNAAAAAIIGRRRPCIAERPPQTGTRLKYWMHATGGVSLLHNICFHLPAADGSSCSSTVHVDGALDGDCEKGMQEDEVCNEGSN